MCHFRIFPLGLIYSHFLRASSLIKPSVLDQITQDVQFSVDYFTLNKCHEKVVFADKSFDHILVYLFHLLITIYITQSVQTTRITLLTFQNW